MIFIKTFKGYEDRTTELDKTVNAWVTASKADVIGIQSALSHEHGARANSGDLIYTIMYRATAPLD